MTSDRPIHLDLRMPSTSSSDSGLDAGPQTTTDQRSDSELENDAQALRALMQSQRDAATDEAMQQKNAALRPVDLFTSCGRISGTTVPAAIAEHGETTSQLLAELGQTLEDMSSRLLINDGRSGARAVQLQLALDSLPGVVMQVVEEGGAVLVVFTCSLEQSRERLASSAPWIAQQLSEKLMRPACIQVQTDDPEDPAMTEARAGY